MNARLVIVFGPPAVGKMTVGREVAAQAGFLFFHGHMTIEPLLTLFPFGSPPFGRLNAQFRDAVFTEVGASDARGLVFTYAWALDVPDDRADIERLIGRLGVRPDEVCFAELIAPLATRLKRNGSPDRIDAKPSKRDRASSDTNLRQADARYVLNSDAAHPFFWPERHLKIDTTVLSAPEAAAHITRHFGLTLHLPHPP